MQSAPGPETTLDGRPYLYFAGTGYLGLQGHPNVIRAGCAALEKYGVHSATSRGGFGNQQPILDVEQVAAEFFGADEAFYFATGYLGNHVLAPLVAPQFDCVWVDDQAHYSMLEALRLVELPVARFRHGDPQHLAEELQKQLQPSQRPLVMTDGVFPVSGEIAPVNDYLAVLVRYPGSGIALDDAHAVGVLGEHGRGTLEHFGLPGARINRDESELPAAAGDEPRLFFCGTLSKAIGGHGGILAGSRAFIGRAKAECRYYDAASTPAAPVAGATAAALRLVMADPGLRTRLRENVRMLKQGLRGLGLAVNDNSVPIAGLAVGDAPNMQRIQAGLMDRGIAIAYTRAYTGVGPDGALRIAVFANHTPAMIERLLGELGKIL